MVVVCLLRIYGFVHNLAPSFFSFTTVMTGCFKRHDLILECVCFTLISSFNMIPLATSTTGQNGHKTQRLYRCIQLVVSCPSFIALKYRKFSHFVFLSELGVFYVRVCCGAVSVLDLYLVSFSYAWSGTGTTGLLGRSEMYCNCIYSDVGLKTCIDWYD